MKQADFDKISEIIADNGFIEWSLVGFTPAGEYKIFSYFTDSSIMPVFRAILVSMLRKIDEYLKGCEGDHMEISHHKGVC
jgi:hypothetical protein